MPEAEVVHVGESLGGAIATELAVRHPRRALILLFPFSSFPDMAQKTVPWLPARWLVRNRLDNLSKIDKVGCPVFITHGTADPVIPFRQVERLYEAPREPKRSLCADRTLMLTCRGQTACRAKPERRSRSGAAFRSAAARHLRPRSGLRHGRARAPIR